MLLPAEISLQDIVDIFCFHNNLNFLRWWSYHVSQAGLNSSSGVTDLLASTS